MKVWIAYRRTSVSVGKKNLKRLKNTIRIQMIPTLSTSVKNFSYTKSLNKFGLQFT